MTKIDFADYCVTYYKELYEQETFNEDFVIRYKEKIDSCVLFSKREADFLISSLKRSKENIYALGITKLLNNLNTILEHLDNRIGFVSKRSETNEIYIKFSNAYIQMKYKITSLIANIERNYEGVRNN